MIIPGRSCTIVVPPGRRARATRRRSVTISVAPSSTITVSRGSFGIPRCYPDRNTAKLFPIQVLDGNISIVLSLILKHTIARKITIDVGERDITSLASKVLEVLPTRIP